MTPIELMGYAKVAVVMAGIFWFMSFSTYLMYGAKDTFGVRKRSDTFLIIAIICVIVMVGFIIAAKIAESSFWGKAMSKINLKKLIELSEEEKKESEKILKTLGKEGRKRLSDMDRLSKNIGKNKEELWEDARVIKIYY